MRSFVGLWVAACVLILVGMFTGLLIGVGAAKAGQVKVAAAQEVPVVWEYKTVTGTGRDGQLATNPTVALEQINGQDIAAGWQVVSLTPVEVRNRCAGDGVTVSGVYQAQACTHEYNFYFLLRRPKS